jgi:pyruvate kinase
MRVVFVGQQEVIAEASATGYLVNGLNCHVERAGRRVMDAKVVELPLMEAPLLLQVGDTILVTADQRPGRLAQRDMNGNIVTPATIPCTLPEIFNQVVINERICFDDGRIEGLIRAVDHEQLTVEITRARDGGAKLRSAKGINLPDSHLDLPCLSLQDRTDLEFAKQHADIVGLSFVHQPSDVTDLMTAIGSNARPLQIVLKIETPQAFAQFPAILLAALGKIPVGVMIARGDLAVEVGFNRLAEVQEEILWLCEAAHIPVIWGTQVLENLAKKGMPTRAEVTDAAMSVRAECVMLNKGPHIVSAVTFLHDVLVRMQQHQQKKRTLMRKLTVSRSMQRQKRKIYAGVK